MATVQPYIAEFVGTLIFLLLVLIIVSKVNQPKWVIAVLIGLALALGIWVALVMGGPGYQNPAVAITLGIKDNKSAAYLSAMIAMELVAAAVAVLIWNAGMKKMVIQ